MSSFAIPSMVYFLRSYYFIFGMWIFQNIYSWKYDSVIFSSNRLLLMVTYSSYVLWFFLIAHVFFRNLSVRIFWSQSKMFSFRDMFPSSRGLEAQPIQQHTRLNSPQVPREVWFPSPNSCNYGNEMSNF